ncbi:MAG: DDE-type integrase/transposase/recombinase [Aliarcobacter sp.]|nr:DDE-type integrase/transposase/recombinase [Aliarcobacter sp.]
MYVETKIASVVYGVTERALQNAVKRDSDKYNYRYIDGVGRGGKKLLIKVDEVELAVAIDKGELEESITIYEELPEGGLGEVAWNDFNGEPKEISVKEEPEIKTAKPKADKEVKYFELDEEQKREATERLRILKDWDEYRKEGVATSKFCDNKNRFDPTLKLSEQKLYRWQRDYKEKGIVGLADMRGKARAGKTTLKPWMQDFVLAQFRAFGAGGINYLQLWDALHEEAARKGECDYIKFIKKEQKPLCDYGTIKRFIDNYYKNNRLEYVMVTLGEDKAKSYLQPAMGNQKELIIRRNQCWQVDSSPLDAMVRDGDNGTAFRPNILSIVDVFSGRSVMSLERTSNALSLVRLLWKALEKFGKPEYIKGDNGKDYLSKQFQELLSGLGIDYDRAIAYAGDEKGFVERHFRTVQHSGISFTPGYIGNSLAKREMIEQRTPKRDRKAKDQFGNVKKTNQLHLLTFEQMKMRLDTEVAKWDIMRIRRKNESPMDRWNSDDTAIRKVAYEEFILYAGRADIRTVAKKGIEYEALRFVGDSLPPVGTKVVCRANIDNAQEIFVFSLTGDFICRAYDKEIALMSAEQYKAVKKVFKEEMRQVRGVIKSAEFSAFTRLAIEEDFERMLEEHKESLKPQKIEAVNSDVVADVREKLREQREVDSIKERVFDIDSMMMPNSEKRNKLSWDSVIERAVNWS